MEKDKYYIVPAKKMIFFCFLLWFFAFLSPLFAQTGHWEQLNPPVSPAPRQSFGMSSIGYHKSLLFGGFGFKTKNNFQYFDDTWLFDYDTRTWSELKSKNNRPDNKSVHGMCQLSENIVLLFGGTTDGTKDFDETWLFNLNDTTWTKLDLEIHPEGRYAFGISQISENIAILFGGKKNVFDLLNDTWLFDLNNKKWICVDSVPDWWNYDKRPYIRNGTVIAPIDKNKVILFGGWTGGGHYFSDTWLFNLDSLKWKNLKVNGFIDSLAGSAGVNFFKTKMFLFGGDDPFTLKNNSLIFDLFDTSWTKIEVDQSPPARTDYGMAKIDDDKVVIFGGFTNEEPIGDTWLFTADSTSDVEEELSDIFSLSPNPATDFLEISVGVRHAEPLQTIEIFSVLGETVLSVGAKGPSPLQIDVSGLPQGIYFVKVGAQVGKFVKI